MLSAIGASRPAAVFRERRLCRDRLGTPRNVICGPLPAGSHHRPDEKLKYQDATCLQLTLSSRSSFTPTSRNRSGFTGTIWVLKLFSVVGMTLTPTSLFKAPNLCLQLAMGHGKQPFWRGPMVAE